MNRVTTSPCGNSYTSTSTYLTGHGEGELEGRGGVADDERVGKLPAGEMAATWYVTIVVLLLERSEKTTASKWWMPPYLASWSPPPSQCWSLPGFMTVDQYPVRSPLAIADYLSSRVRNLNFCEIGTRNGDIMECLKHYAKSGARLLHTALSASPKSCSHAHRPGCAVTAVEMDHTYCRKLRQRGFRVICKPIENVPPAELADCQVYFWWPMQADPQNEAWLRLLIDAHRQSGMNASVYVAHDTHWALDMKVLPMLVKAYDGDVARVFFDEGGELSGEASYSQSFHSRPGRWGVFHVARFEVGVIT